MMIHGERTCVNNRLIICQHTKVHRARRITNVSFLFRQLIFCTSCELREWRSYFILDFADKDNAVAEGEREGALSEINLCRRLTKWSAKRQWQLHLMHQTDDNYFDWNDECIAWSIFIYFPCVRRHRSTMEKPKKINQRWWPQQMKANCLFAFVHPHAIAHKLQSQKLFIVQWKTR